MFLVNFLWYLSRRWRRWSRTRGPRVPFFFPPSEEPRESYGNGLLVLAAGGRERYRVNLLAQNLPHLSRQRPEMPQPVN